MKSRGRKSKKPVLVELMIESNQWEVINAFLAKFKEGTLLDIEIKRRQRTNSDPMRAFYYSQILPPLLEATGYEKYEGEVVHHHLKGLFFENHPNAEWRTHKDERGIYRNVPHVFSKKSPIPISEKKKFISFVERIGVQYGAEYE